MVKQALYYILAASCSFVFLNCVTLSSFALSEHSSLLFTGTNTSPDPDPVAEPETPPTQKSEYEVTLEIDTESFKWLSLSESGETFLKVKQSRKKNSIALAAGEYTFKAKVLETGEILEFYYQINVDTQIYCGQAQDSHFGCIDQNDMQLKTTIPDQ